MEFLASYLLSLKILFILTAFFIFLSSLDDFFIDICYYSRRLWRHFFVYNKHSRLTKQDLYSKPEQNFAILIPAWHEYDVIEAMLINCLSTVQYDKYHIFIGCYPNDLKTVTITQKIMKQFLGKVTVAICPHDGPTNKADCLNAIYHHIQDYELKNLIKFDGFILHDAEDIVHPLELKLFNYLIGRKDMVQIPVIALERPLLNLTGGHYQDEFSESHAKDLVVREFLTGQVPCAGVGCAFSRKALLKLCAEHEEKNPFNNGNLTEDYDMALRLNKLKMEQVFVRCKIGDILRSSNLSPKARKDIIATREFFPDDFSSAVKQKSRWIIGIVFQGWQSQKWKGSLGLKYMLYRDRKSILTSFFSMLAYFIILNLALIYGMSYLDFGTANLPPFIRSDEPVIYFLWANLFFLINRVLNRMVFCYSNYGVVSALMSFPRLIWGNIINFFASERAVRLFTLHLLTGKPLVWEKTDHHFPTPEQLAPFKEYIGEILKSQGIIDNYQLERALKIQENLSPSKPLGEIMTEEEIIAPHDLTNALQRQNSFHSPSGEKDAV